MGKRGKKNEKQKGRCIAMERLNLEFRKVGKKLTIWVRPSLESSRLRELLKGQNSREDTLDILIPLVTVYLWYNDRGGGGWTPKPCKSYNPFRGLHLICFHSST